MGSADFWKNDIAVVKLEDDYPVGPEDPNIGIVPLPQTGLTDWPPVGAECVMKGWGCTESGKLYNSYVVEYVFFAKMIKF